MVKVSPKPPQAPVSAPVKGMGLAKKLGIEAVMGVAKKLGIGTIAGIGLGTLLPIIAACRGEGQLPTSTEILLQRCKRLRTLRVNHIFKFWAKHGFIQDVLLTRLPKLILKKLAPEKEKLVDSRAAKVARIIFMSFLYLIPARITIKDPTVRPYIIAGIATNTAISAIKETGLGSFGALSGIVGRVLFQPMLIK